MKNLIEEAEQPQIEFFQPELRDGFFISTMMKRFWAAQIKVLGEIDRICQIYNIKYFADCGTLLGAVRHGGYIPWDDDLDICMLRDDYIRFIEIAEKELPDGYIVINIHNDAEYDSFNCRVNNSANIENSDQRIKGFFGCPYIVGIDIFVLDGLSDNDEFENLRRSVLNDIAYAIEMIDKYSGTLDANVERLLKKIEETHHIKLDRSADVKKQLLLLTEKNYSLFPTQKTNRVAKMTKWVANNKCVFKKELFENIIRMPFEYIHIPVPACYDAVLRKEYGRYMKVIKGGGGHNYPLYARQEKRLKEELGENPYRYTMPQSVRAIRDIASVSERCYELIKMLKQVLSKAIQFLDVAQRDASEQLITGCNSLVDSLEAILQERARYYEATSSLLDEYKDTLSGYLNDTNDQHREEQANRADALVDQLTDAIEAVSERKEVLFLPVKADWWKTMEPVWRQAVADENNDVYVMPLLYLEKDFVRDNGEERNDGKLLPDYVELTSIENYDIAKRHPDVVYIQDPYDGYNTMIAVPSYFYSDNLLKFTDELIYVPCYDVDDPESPDDKITSALRIIVEQPAVYNADKVIVKDSKIKDVYIDILSSITGKECIDYWKNKISVSDSYIDPASDLLDNEVYEKRKVFFDQYGLDTETDKKILLMQINAAFIIQNGKKAIDKIKSAVDEMNKYRDSIICIFSTHESTDQLSKIVDDPLLVNDFNLLIDEISKNDRMIYDANRHIENYLNVVDVYYGNEGAFAHKIRMNKKSVMIMSA